MYITTQSEWDALPQFFDKKTILHIRSQERVIINHVPLNAAVVVRGSSRVVLTGHSTAELCEYSSAELRDYSSAKLYDRSRAWIVGSPAGVSVVCGNQAGGEKP